ncbi:MAG: hypothetical protein Q4P08_02955 [Eubacteriales bacterium]|nr:hypothetical protein [Eubacteriales bacterium]
MSSLKEGRCYNCGSILHLDPQMEKGHCIYCDAVFENERAFEIAANPDDYSFENKEMPPYEGPNLDPKPSSAPVVNFSPPPKATAKKQAEAKPVYEPKIREIPDVKADRKVALIAGGAIALCILLFLAIVLPQTINRDKQREEMANTFSQAVKTIGGSSEQVILGEDFVITGMKNNRGILILQELKDEAQAKEYFKAFVEARGRDANGEVVLDLIAKDKTYRLSQDGRDAEIELRPDAALD